MSACACPSIGSAGDRAAKAVLTAPEVKDFQPAARFSPGDAIAVPKGRGWLLVIEGVK
jgi:hypothetical protein